MSASKIGTRIRRAREARNLGVLDFCAGLSISTGRLRGMEQGHEIPTEREIMEMMVKHGLSGDELFEADEQQEGKVARFLDHAELLKSLYKAARDA